MGCNKSSAVRTFAEQPAHMTHIKCTEQHTAHDNTWPTGTGRSTRASQAHARRVALTPASLALGFHSGGHAGVPNSSYTLRSSGSMQR